jgi:serine/threonine-protein kinase RsbW
MCSRATPPPFWEQTFPNQLPELMRAIDALETFLESHGASSRATYIARLAAEEMGTNIIKYGYDDSAEHLITLRARAQPDEFRVELIDDGHEFDPTSRSEPPDDLTLDERAPGGWGISLVRRLARAVHYERRSHQNVLTVEISRLADDH